MEGQARRQKRLQPRRRLHREDKIDGSVMSWENIAFFTDNPALNMLAKF